MAELAGRDRIERQFEERMAALNKRQRAELLRLLGTPPDPANVPESFWQQAEREMEEELLAVLLLIVATSAVQHGGTLDQARTIGRRYADGRAKEVSRSFWRTTKDRLQTAGERWRQERERARKDAPAGTPVSNIPPQQQVAADLGRILGDDRATGLAVSETTSAASAGGESIAAELGTASEEDTWFTARDQRVCPICAPLHSTRRSNWTRFFPSGPPAHPWCRCWIEYATVPSEATS